MDLSEKIIPIRENKEKGIFMREDNYEVIQSFHIEMLNTGAIVLEIGDNYVQFKGFRNLGKIPERANAILLGEEYRLGRTELITGSYCILNKNT